MSKISSKFKGTTDLQGKPKIWFCCHPADFKSCFEDISDNILNYFNCVICYEEEPYADYEVELFLTDLSEMRLFVIPVTLRFLKEESRARDVELKFAVKQNIPVLPLMMESGLDEPFEEVFGSIHYLNWFQGSSEIPSEEKLKEHLEKLLVGDEQAEKIRAEFIAQIFLSYRKKDRIEAHELMKKIHEIDFCRDLAIWFDDYLIFGEDYNLSIEKAIKDSSVFSMLVTPNLVNEDNYVMKQEYPKAKEEEKPILPVEMRLTDRAQLEEKYADIPPCTKAEDAKALSEILRAELNDLGKMEELNENPEHLYNIGLAYLNGINVEVNSALAEKLITYAAEAGLEEAMEQLSHMYTFGDGVKPSDEKVIYWIRRSADYYRKKVKEDPSCLFELCITLLDLASALMSSGKLDESLQISGEVKSVVDDLSEEAMEEEKKEELDFILLSYNLSLGNAFVGAMRAEEAEVYADEAEKFSQRLIERNPDKYNYCLCLISSLKGNILIYKMAKKAVDVDSSENFIDEVKRCAVEAARYADEAERYARAGLQIARNMAAHVLKTFLIASACIELANVLMLKQSVSEIRSNNPTGALGEKESYQEAEKLVLEAEQLFEQLSEKQPDLYRVRIEQAKDLLEHLYLLQGEYDKISAEEYVKGSESSSPLSESLESMGPNDTRGAILLELGKEAHATNRLRACLDSLDHFHGAENERNVLLDKALSFCSVSGPEQDLTWALLRHRLAGHLWDCGRSTAAAEMECDVLRPYEIYTDSLPKGEDFIDFLNITEEIMQRLFLYSPARYMPKVFLPLINIATQAENIESFEEAEKIYLELLKLEPEWTTNYAFYMYTVCRRLAFLKYYQKKYEEAFPLLQKAIDLYRDDNKGNYKVQMENMFFMLVLSARLQCKLGRPDKEAEDYLEALQWFEKKYSCQDNLQDKAPKNIYITEDSVTIVVRKLEQVLNNSGREEDLARILLQELDFLRQTPNLAQDPLTSVLRLDTALALFRIGNREQAEQLARESMDFWTSLAPDSVQMNEKEARRCRDFLELL